MLYDTELASPVGVLTLLAEEDALLGLWIAGQKFHGSALLQAARRGDCPALRAAEDWLARYFAGQAPDPWALSLRPAGTAFQRRVWEALRRIPYGATRSYGDLARELGTSPRAVGAAAGRKPHLDPHPLSPPDGCGWQSDGLRGGPGGQGGAAAPGGGLNPVPFAYP